MDNVSIWETEAWGEMAEVTREQVESDDGAVGYVLLSDYDELQDKAGQLWVAGQYKEQTQAGNVAWEFQGIFESEELACKACLDVHYFVAPVTLNALVPKQMVDWEGAYYPGAWSKDQ